MEDTIKLRRLRFANHITEENRELCCHNLSLVSGVLDVSYDQPDRLNIRYELQDINLAAIEQKLADWGGQLSSRFINRFVRGWIHFTEENEVQNLRSVPQSCCSVPESQK